VRPRNPRHETGGEAVTKYLRAVGAFAACWLAAWLCGYDFDERNAMVAYWFVVSIAASALAFSYPGDDE
jgi:hypothetical protein